MEKPGFYAILPSPVRYDRRLSASEKVFFAEITALSDQCGYCYAGNGYFSELYDTSDRTVQRWVKHLQELGYVAVTNVRDGAAMQRRISPLPDAPHEEAPETEADKNVGERHPVSAGDKNVAPTPTKMSPTPRQKCRLEQYKNNNTRENNTRAGARASVRDVLREEVLCANTGAREATGLFAPALFFFRVCWRVSSAEPPRVKRIAPYHPRWRGSRPQGRSGPGLYAV